MKNIFLTSVCIVVLSLGLRAQTVDCATGYCPATITVYHKAGNISPVTVPITYGVVALSTSGVQKCWITRNLGATAPAASYIDATDAASGWYWQFGKKQGWAVTAGVRSPTFVVSPASTVTGDFPLSEDPCTLLLGSNWRIPTATEYNSVLSVGMGWLSMSSAYQNTGLKLHYAGGINMNTNSFITAKGNQASNFFMISRTSSSSTTSDGFYYAANNGAASTYTNITRADYGTPVRCLRAF
jgi:hypothetical protein